MTSVAAACLAIAGPDWAWAFPSQRSRRDGSAARDGHVARSTKEEEADYDLAAYVDASPEDRLRMLRDAYLATKDERYRLILEGQMLGLTVDLDEHPEWFDCGCLCDTCRSYGD